MNVLKVLLLSTSLTLSSLHAAELPHIAQYKPGIYKQLNAHAGYRPINTPARIKKWVYVDEDTLVSWGYRLPREIGDILTEEVTATFKAAELVKLRGISKAFSEKITFHLNGPVVLNLKGGFFKSLVGFYFSDDDTQRYFEMIKNKSLTLSTLNPGKRFFDDEGFPIFLNALNSARMPAMIFLGRALAKEGCIAWFADGMAHNDYIKALLIETGDMCERDEDALGTILEKSPNLEEFFIRPAYSDKRGAVSDRGALAVANRLREHKKIRFLAFENCSIGDLGARFLANTLCGDNANSSLRKLLLDGNRITYHRKNALRYSASDREEQLEMDFELSLL